MTSARPAALALLATLLLARVLAGQVPSPTGSLYGTALDAEGKYLPGVVVTLSGPGAAQVATTNTKGDFRFLNLSPGAYSVTLERTGFETARREATITLGKNAVLMITMSVAGAVEEVLVSGESLSSDSRQTETGETFDRKYLDTIPTTRDPWTILRQVPGVLVGNMNVNGSETGTQSTFVGKGSRADQNTYNLDGVAITDVGGGAPMYFDFDSFEDIEVVTGGSDPEIATPGVALNLVTRRGTNELKGSGRAYYFFPSSVDSPNRVPSNGSWDYGLEAGGPLWKDHLWLWASWGANDIPAETAVLSDGEVFRGINELGQWNAKLNAEPFSGNSLTLFYLHTNKVFDGRGAGPYRSIASSWYQTTPTDVYRGADAQVLSQKVFAAISFSYVGGDFTLAPKGGLDVQADIDADYVWQNSYLHYNSRRPQRQAGITASGFFETGSLSHELKFGFGYRHTQTDSLTVWPGNQVWGNEYSGLATVTRTSNPKYLVNYYDTYVGDTIQSGSLTVHLGLRFDYQQARNRPSAVPANPAFPELLPAVQYGGDENYAITWRLLQPRVGATYALGQEKKTLLRASYSKFADQLGKQIYLINAFPGPAALYYYWTDADGSHTVERDEVDTSSLLYWDYVNPLDTASNVPVNQVSPDYKSPKTSELIFGIERQIGANLKASIAYTHRSVQDAAFPWFPYAAQPIVGVTPADYRYAGNASGTATAADGFALSFSEPYYALDACPDPCAGIVIENRPDYSMTYNGVELQVEKRFSRGWSLRAGFGYNDWNQTVGPGAIVNPNNLRGGTNASGAVVEPAGDFLGNSGSFVNSKWQFNMSGTVLLPLGVTAAVNFFGRQGFPTVYFVRAILNDSRGRQNIPLQIGQVSAYRNPDVYQLDLHVERPFRVGRFTFTPALDCFNVIDSHTVLQRSGFVGFYNATGEEPSFDQDANFNSPSELLSDRTFRAGLRISF
jgi:hypothetical protein